MADAASATIPPVGDEPTPQTYEFHGTPRNLMPGVALLFAGAMAFTMGMTDVFFAEAIAWTFAIWGGLLIYGSLLDIYNSYVVTEDALLINNPVRFWEANKKWYWGNINRMEIVVKRAEPRPNDIVMMVYYTPTGELNIEREDRQYDPTLAQLILERAALKPANKNTPQNLHRLPHVKATYTWNR